MQFTHLHLHSEYSLLDGLIRIPELVNKAKEFGMKSVALTDHGMMSGVFDFWSNCRANGIKPIIGCESYIAVRSRFDKVAKIDDKRYHIVLLAKNLEGYKNLIKLVSLSHIEGFYYKPRIDKELLQKYGKGIIGLTACISGIINNQLLNKRESEADEWANFLKESLDELYIEIQRTKNENIDKIIPLQIEFAKKHNLKIVATCDAHTILKEDWKAQEILWAISDGRTIDDEGRRKVFAQEFYFKSSEEMQLLYKDIPEAIENTQLIAEKIEEFDITYQRLEPKLPPVVKGDPFEFLKKQALKGLKIRYPNTPKKIKDQFEQELKIINEKQYTKYFLVCWDLCKYAKENDIWMGPGRGSGPSSIVAYSLGITNVDPIRWDLPFERFLNPERNSPPDFDLDFEDEKRDLMFDYMHKTYGKDTFVNICTFGRMKTRAAIRDVARVLGIDLQIADKLSKMVTVKFGKVAKLDDMISNNQEFKEIIESNSELKLLAKYVRKIEGLVRHVSMHACAMALAPDSMMNYIPLMLETRNSAKNGERRIMTQIEGYPLEPMGFLKIDFLALSNITILKKTVKNLEERRNIKIKLEEIPLDDKKTFDLLKKAETTAIFQLESDGMKKYLLDLQPENMEDIMFMAAAYRPGPMKNIPDYIERKHKRQKVIYPHPDTKPILQNTYGFAIYQEQVMKIAVVMAGYSMGEADVLRRAMGKKKIDIMMQEKKKFIDGCLKKNYSKEVAEKLFEYMIPFADYGFNRSHALCYSLIIYWTAYFKANFPVEFLTSLMETDIESSDKLTRDIIEAERMGIKILPPDINKSFCEFVIENGNMIRYSLRGIKNVSREEIKRIVEERKNGNYKGLYDLIKRIKTQNISKKTLECLIKVGAFDQFGSRNCLLQNLPDMYLGLSKLENKTNGGQTGFFENSETNNLIDNYTMTSAVEETDREKLQWEKELLGTYLSTHPLKEFMNYFNDEILSVPEAKKIGPEKEIKVGGIISSKKVISTKKSNKKMAFINIEYYQDCMEGVIFSDTYEKYKEKLETDKPYIFFGQTSNRSGKISLIVNEIMSFKKYKEMEVENIEIDISKENDPFKLKIIKQGILDNPGPTKVYLSFTDSNGKKQRKLLKNKVKLTQSFKSLISNYLVNN